MAFYDELFSAARSRPKFMAQNFEGAQAKKLTRVKIVNLLDTFGGYQSTTLNGCNT